MDARTQQILVFLAIGLVAGYLASWVVGGRGILQYLVSGVVGAFVGGYLLSAAKIDLGIRSPLVAQIVTSTIGAIVVVVLARLIA
ncbi:MAG: GlsB/YeaQ/YmgE family stress response membrane protein [Hyphomicrobiaceae bacterium]